MTYCHKNIEFCSSSRAIRMNSKFKHKFLPTEKTLRSFICIKINVFTFSLLTLVLRKVFFKTRNVAFLKA